ncbi:hypothetical protein [Glycomyces paridis]|uniref:Uncharacterized protein n=1 Tax=Glycomyces paridis TaxID=2126555 RepID=A0A4S8P2E9_9ACTN|nr:hypothetical protein [Glycomyces paridis]THV24257.1 hypothetical protein E9998_21775 [Glycomyces paridis]
MATGRTYLAELREFLGFLRSLWGLLAGVSVLFPLSNLLAEVVPIDQDGRPFTQLDPATLTAITMVTCIFITFATFHRRDEFTDDTVRRAQARKSRIAFTVALAAGAAYLFCRTFAYDNIIELDTTPDYADFMWKSAIYEGVFAVLYVAFFALLTWAFLLLALLEYQRDEA